jgi:hypothetical protein
MESKTEGEKQREESHRSKASIKSILGKKNLNSSGMREQSIPRTFTFIFPAMGSRNRASERRELVRSSSRNGI